MADRSRRSLLRALGVAAAGLAGCASEAADTATPATEASTPSDTPMATATVTPTEVETDTASPTRTATAAETPDDMPVTGPPTRGVDAFDRAVPEFMREWNVPGGAVAVMDEERLVFTRGYGLADPANAESEDADPADGDPVQPDSLFRIGSISKPLTAVAVLDVVERGALSLDDRAFDVLADLVPEGGPADPRVSEITIRQLLRHTAGWDRREQGFDPVFSPVRVAEEQGTTPPASTETMIEFVLDRELGFDPGTAFRYSNFGYCVLGQIVETVTGDSYESRVTDAVLEPVGISRMQVGATRQDGRLDGEVRYRSHDTVESPFPDVGEVPRPYAATHLPAIEAAGGWVGSTVDLLRLVRGVDGRRGVPDVLDAGTRETMTARPDVPQWQGADQYYGMGWFVVPGEEVPSLWHDGSMPGSYGFLLHRADDEVTLAALFNGRSTDPQYRQFNVRAQRTLMGALGDVSEWPDRDLFDRYP